jgi:precorrin-2 dehydrogenase/sirohydrochlorin ferrochelatase
MRKSENKPARYYPLFLDLGGRTCLVVGGGAVGERKIMSLLQYGAVVRLVAGKLTPWLDAKCLAKEIILAASDYDKSHLQGADLAFAATNDAALNRRVSEDAGALGIWCNMATDPEAGSFIVPSVVRRGPLSIAISTSGLSPAISRALRLQLESEFGPEWEFFILLLGELRAHFQAANLEEKDTRRVFSALAALPVPGWLREGGGDEAFRAVAETCGALIRKDELQPVWDDLWKRFF